MIESNNLLHADEISAAADCIFNPAANVCISRSERGRLLGGVIYQGFNGASITMHVAGFVPGWINPDLLYICFHYPFEQLGCRSIFGQTPSRNLKALEFNRKLGFTEIFRVPEYFPDDDMVVFRMNRGECRWLKIKPRFGDVDGREEGKGSSAS